MKRGRGWPIKKFSLTLFHSTCISNSKQDLIIWTVLMWPTSWNNVACHQGVGTLVAWHSLKRVLLKTNMLNKKMMHFYIGKARPLFHLFSIFLHQRYNCYNKYWDRKNICTIQYRDSNFWRLNREARPLTNRRRCGRPISMHLQLGTLT